MTIGPLTEIQAALAYLIPVVVAVLWWSQRKASLAEVALWIPTAVATDVLGTLLLTWVLPLDGAVLLTRGLWLALAVLLLRHHGWRLAWPSSVTRGHLIVIGATGVAAFLLSASISRPASIWDRQFHVPLVTMMRGQRLPFLTVFQSKTVLHFHFGGDVVSAALQTFSLGRMHSSLALALTHDLMFFLTGVSLAAWLTSIAGRAAWIVPSVLAVFLSGPMALQRTGMGPIVAGYSVLNLLCMSYRPAISLAILLLVGALAAISLRIQSADRSDRRVVLSLLACMAILAICDEPSAALLGLAMAVLWLVRPGALHPDRKVGLLILVAGVAAIIVPNLLFQAALVPGGPVQKVSLVPLRAPGFVEGPLPLGSKKGLYAMALDLAPFLMILVAFCGATWRDRRQRVASGATGVMTAVLMTILVGTALALAAIDVNQMPMENHRFMTICEVMFPAAALILLARLPTGNWERVLLIGALLIPAVSSWYWADYGTGSPDDWFTNRVDCRASAGAGLLDRPRPTYIPKSHLYEFAGCRAVFVPGSANLNSWGGVLLNGYASGGKGAFQPLHETFVGPRENLRAACHVNTTEHDVLCDYVQSRGRCKPAGANFRVCEVTPEDRAALAQMAW